MKTKKTAKPYEWDWDGEAVVWVNGPPTLDTRWTHYNYETFSVGIFQWIPTKNGKGVKRAKAIKRITGKTSDPEKLFKRVQAMVDELNEKKRRDVRQRLIFR